MPFSYRMETKAEKVTVEYMMQETLKKCKWYMLRKAGRSSTPMKVNKVEPI